MEDYKKKYEDALNSIRESFDYDNLAYSGIKEKLEKAFPELKESEDEKFLRYIIACCKDTIESDDKGLELSMDTTKRLFAWLEKQGEQKSEINDNILLRFAFYQYDNDTIYLSSVFVEECNRKHGYGTKILKAAENVAKTFGVSKIRLKVERNTWMEEWYKKNGYEYLSPDGEYDWLEKRVEQKPAWNEEDERMLGKAISIIRYALSIPIDKEDDLCFAGSSTISWLKSLKERIICINK